MVATTEDIGAAPFFVPASSSPLTLRIARQTRDFLVFALWVGVTYVQFPYDELLLYPLALYYAYAVWRDQAVVVPLAARAWIIFAFPLWCFISPIWATEPVSAFKEAVYLLLTLTICVHTAATLAPRRIMWAVLLATGVIGVLSLVEGLRTGAISIGIFAQKNTMGKSMVVLWVAAACTALDRGTPWPIRLAGFALAALAGFLSVMSESATAMLLVLATGAIAVASSIVLRGGFFRASRLALASVVSGVGVLALSVVVPTMQTSPVDRVLAAFGKDATLTGRTLLWNYAERQIADAPWLGVGAGGFWRYHASPLIRRIYEEFYKGPNDHFNFHNSYYEIAVHQGLLGLLLVVLAILWAAGWLTRAALAAGTIPTIFFFTQGLAVLVRTATEADFLKPFVLFHMLFWIGALVAVRAAMERRAGLGPAP